MMQVSKEITFDCAHRLYNYLGKCSRIHGHTYKVRISVSGNTLKPSSNNPNEAMVIDFSVLGNFLSVVKDVFDHRLCLFNQDLLIDVLRDGGVKIATFDQVVSYYIHSGISRDKEASEAEVIILPYQPTAECFTLLVDEIFKRFLKESFSQTPAFFGSYEISVWETPISYATLRR